MHLGLLLACIATLFIFWLLITAVVEAIRNPKENRIGTARQARVLFIFLGLVSLGRGVIQLFSSDIPRFGDLLGFIEEPLYTYFGNLGYSLFWLAAGMLFIFLSFKKLPKESR